MCVCVCVCTHTLNCFSCVWLFVTLWTSVLQASLSMGFSRQEYWCGLPCPLPGDLLTQGSNLHLLCLLHWQVGSFLLSPPGKPSWPSIVISEVAQSCLTLCDPMDCSLPSSSVHGIFQAIVLEWIAISFSRGSSRPKNWTRVSHIVDRRFTVWATREVLTQHIHM